MMIAGRALFFWVELCTDDGGRKIEPVAGGDKLECRQFAVWAAVEDVVDDIDVHFVFCQWICLGEREMTMMGQRTESLLTQRSYIPHRSVFQLGHSSHDSKIDLVFHALRFSREASEKSCEVDVLGGSVLHHRAGVLFRGCVFRACVFRA